MSATVTANGSSKKPSVLIIGGLGYIGRFLAKHIHTLQLASTVRIVDKVLPQLARLAPEFSEACSQSIFLQADASRSTPENLNRIFSHPDVPDGKWDYVFNLGGETAYSQTYEIYRLKSYQLSETLAAECARRGVRAYVEASTGMVYAPNRTPRTETDKLKPWTKLAKVALEREVMLSKIPSLNLIILRLPHVYGEYDTGIIGTVLCLARIHQAESKELKWLWTADLRQHTVHVQDCARALWHAATWRANNSPSEPIFNIVDHNDTSQGSLSTLVAQVFQIKTAFSGTLVSQFARLNLENVVDDMNEEMLGPWHDMLAAKDLQTGSLSPWLEKDLLKDSDLSLDGGLFESATGFKYEKERFTTDEMRRMIDSYDRMGWWP